MTVNKLFDKYCWLHHNMILFSLSFQISANCKCMLCSCVCVCGGVHMYWLQKNLRLNSLHVDTRALGSLTQTGHWAFIKYLMKQWKMTHGNNLKPNAQVSSYVLPRCCPAHAWICKIITKRDFGYLFQSRATISRPFFMEDITMYAKSGRDISLIYVKDIRMLFGLDKCSWMASNWLKVITTQGVELPESNIGDVHDSSLRTASLRQMGIYEEPTSMSTTGTYNVRQVLKTWMVGTTLELSTSILPLIRYPDDLKHEQKRR